MIVCEEALLNGIPEQFKDWDKIYVTLEDASKFSGGNVMLFYKSQSSCIKFQCLVLILNEYTGNNDFHNVFASFIVWR